MIKEFKGKHYFLSNSSNSRIEYDGYIYLNAEAAFQAQKNSSSTYKYLMQFQDANTAIKEGTKVKLRLDWEQIKDKIMYNIIKAKFIQNKDLQIKLLETNDKKLLDINDYHDNYWSKCTCERCIRTTTNNTNNLGEILMQIRNELKKEKND